MFIPYYHRAYICGQAMRSIQIRKCIHSKIDSQHMHTAIRNSDFDTWSNCAAKQSHLMLCSAECHNAMILGVQQASLGILQSQQQAGSGQQPQTCSTPFISSSHF